MIALLSLLCVLTASAKEAPLEAGFRGRTYGDAKVIAKKPFEVCVPVTAPTVAWSCVDTLAGYPAAIHYVVEAGLFVGVYIRIDGDFATNLAVVAYLMESWGLGDSGGAKLQRLWIGPGGDVIASVQLGEGFTAVTIASTVQADEAKLRSTVKQ